MPGYLLAACSLIHSFGVVAGYLLAACSLVHSFGVVAGYLLDACLLVHSFGVVAGYLLDACLLVHSFGVVAGYLLDAYAVFHTIRSYLLVTCCMSALWGGGYLLADHSLHVDLSGVLTGCFVRVHSIGVLTDYLLDTSCVSTLLGC